MLKINKKDVKQELKKIWIQLIKYLIILTLKIKLNQSLLVKFQKDLMYFLVKKWLKKKLKKLLKFIQLKVIGQV